MVNLNKRIKEILRKMESSSLKSLINNFDCYVVGLSAFQLDNLRYLNEKNICEMRLDICFRDEEEMKKAHAEIEKCKEEYFSINFFALNLKEKSPGFLNVDGRSVLYIIQNLNDNMEMKRIYSLDPMLKELYDEYYEFFKDFSLYPEQKKIKNFLTSHKMYIEVKDRETLRKAAKKAQKKDNSTIKTIIIKKLHENKKDDHIEEEAMKVSEQIEKRIKAKAIRDLLVGKTKAKATIIKGYNSRSQNIEIREMGKIIKKENRPFLLIENLKQSMPINIKNKISVVTCFEINKEDEHLFLNVKKDKKGNIFIEKEVSFYFHEVENSKSSIRKFLEKIPQFINHIHDRDKVKARKDFSRGE